MLDNTDRRKHRYERTLPAVKDQKDMDQKIGASLSKDRLLKHLHDVRRSVSIYHKLNETLP